MNIPYRHRRMLKQLFTVLAIVLLVFSVTWVAGSGSKRSGRS